LAITILMICYTLLAFGIGWYLFSHRARPFLVFHPETTPALSRVVTVGGLILMLLGVVAAAATIINNSIFLASTLLVGVVIIIVLQLILLHWFPKG